MELFLNQDPANPSFPWKEWHLQAYVVMKSRQSNITVHGDTNGASKTPKGWGQAAATGMLKGWPDLCFVLPARGAVFVELKLGTAKRSPEQIALHDVLRACGVVVHTVSAHTPAECWDKIIAIIAAT